MVVVKNSLPAPARWDNASQDDKQCHADLVPVPGGWVHQHETQLMTAQVPGPLGMQHRQTVQGTGTADIHQDLSDGHGPLDLTR